MNNQWFLNRRELLGLGVGVGALFISRWCIAGTEETDLYLTPKQPEGPFYPLNDQADKDADLVHIKGEEGAAAGDQIEVRGRLLDQQGEPIVGALVEIWHANKWGRYDHVHDRNSAPLDPHFQGWGQQLTAEDGSYAFRTIFPGIYPAAPDWKRPPHIHFKISHRGRYALTTQMYFPGQKLNESDLLLQRVPHYEQSLLIAKRVDVTHKGEAQVTQYVFDIVLR